GVMEEVVLLPFTPTPVTDEIVGPIHARLSGHRIAGDSALLEETAIALGATVFPGWELYAPLAGGECSFFDLLPNAAVMLNEPTAIQRELDHWWERVADLHERSQVGALAPPHELYFVADAWLQRIDHAPGASLE